MAILFDQAILMPQLTSYACRKLNRTIAMERQKATFEKSKAAAIEKYGAVLVNAAERWARQRYPEFVGFGLGDMDPYYEYAIRMYRGAYRRAMWDAALSRRPRRETRKPIRPVVVDRTLRAIERLHDGPSRPFVGAYLLEARRD